jgi:probable HAF family extracellular repeat protein
MTHTLPLALLATALGGGTQVFTPVDPDLGAQTSFGAAFEINAAGQIVGTAAFVGGPSSAPALWSASGAHALPLLPGDDVGIAVGVNGEGDAVGTSTDLQTVGSLTFLFDHPVLWTHGQAVDVRTLVSGGAPLELLTAVDVDDAGRIVGQARLPAGVGRGYLLEDGIVTDLGDLNPGGAFSGTQVAAIGADGSVVGGSTAPTSFTHAFRWQEGVMSDLHDFAQMPGRNSHAFDINAFGVICGSGDFVADFLDYEEAVLFDHGAITNLGTLAEGEPWAQAFALGINDINQVVGATNLPSGEPRAFLWQGGAMADLNAFLPSGTGWVLTSAEDITNDGRIIGQGFYQGALRAFLLIPDGQGSFTPYATGCPGAGDFVPSLAGVGLPADGHPFGLAVAGGMGGAFGALGVGLGQGSLPLSGTCSLSIAPLTSILVPLSLDGSGPGGGTSLTVFHLPGTLAPLSVNVQAAFLDFDAPGFVSATNALAIDIP